MLHQSEHLFERFGRGFVVERLNHFRSMMIRERFGEARDLDRMQAREFVTRRLQLHGRSIRSEITDVGPVEYFDRFSCAGESGRCKSSPKSLKTDVSSG